MRLLKVLLLNGFLALGLVVGLATPGQAAVADSDYFTQAELDQMLAPVALYPDTVLSHVLIAATYPLEVVQAARWSRNNPGLSGEEAVAAVENRNWDPSVMALVAFPDLIARLDEDLEWTQRMGDAFLMQEEDVIDTIQYLRAQAHEHGSLQTNEHVRVIRETEYIYIEPARSRVVYVPYYDPRVVYGSWRWSAYPPYYWSRPPAFRTSVSFHWGIGYRVRPTFYFSSFHWGHRQVRVVHHHHHHHHHHSRRHFSSGREVARYSGSSHWKHNPQHRRGVSYRQGVDQTRFVRQQADASIARSAGPSNSSDSRPVRNRAAQSRSDQRDWASQRRDNLQIRGDSSRSTGDGSSRAQARADRSSSRSSDSGPASRQAASSRTSSDSRTSGDRTSRSTSARTGADSSSSAADGAQQRSRSGNLSSRSASRDARGDSAAAPNNRAARTRATVPTRSSAGQSRPAASSSTSPSDQDVGPARSRADTRSSSSSAPARQQRSSSAPARQSPPSRSAGRSAAGRSAPSTRPAASQRDAAPARSAPSRSVSSPSSTRPSSTRPSGTTSSRGASGSRSTAPSQPSSGTRQGGSSQRAAPARQSSGRGQGSSSQRSAPSQRGSSQRGGARSGGESSRRARQRD